MSDTAGNQAWAFYYEFGIGDSASKYTLTARRYKGTSGDSLSSQNGSKFTTTDSDNDNSGINCANSHGLNWHNSCCWSCPFDDFASATIWFGFQEYTQTMN